MQAKKAIRGIEARVWSILSYLWEQDEPTPFQQIVDVVASDLEVTAVERKEKYEDGNSVWVRQVAQALSQLKRVHIVSNHRKSRHWEATYVGEILESSEQTMELINSWRESNERLNIDTPILVCRVGWMKNYASKDEEIKGGGGFVEENEDGGEIYNFKLHSDGCYYGYVRVTHGGKIDIQNYFDASKLATAINGLLVIFCASPPSSSSKQLIVGWYKNATVPLVSFDHPFRGEGGARFLAKEATLIPPEHREFRIPHSSEKLEIGGMGMSNTWYGANYDKARSWKKELIDYIRSHDKTESKKKDPTNADGSGTKESSTVGQNHILNRILFGPPGTGKTWHAVNHALAIIDGTQVQPDVERERFDELRFNPYEETGQIAMVTFHQNYAYEDFVEGIRPSLAADNSMKYELRPGIFKRIANVAQANPDKRYVLVIDEINRGNIAKIFGELITLIEDSRRIGREDATTVTLPYSANDFRVPSNLYLIGTMNTADRSIQLLDTALRRRFTFFEMMPNPDHERIPEDIDGVECRKVLAAMNRRICMLLDRERQIGHTYLMGVTTVKQLSEAFRYKIFPLLQEYFFDDWAKIKVVLGGNGFVTEEKAEKLVARSDFNDEDQMLYGRLTDPDGKSPWDDPDEYVKIYKGSNDKPESEIE